MKLSLPESASRQLGRQKLLLQKNSPHILFGVGLAGMIGTTVLACRATLKAKAQETELKDPVYNALNRHEQVKVDGSGSLMEARADIGKALTLSAARTAKIYAVPVVLGGVSTTALVASHIQMTRRNAALTMAFGAAVTAFEEYRARIIEEIGEEREGEIFYMGRNSNINPDGTCSVPTSYSLYARSFERGNPNWRSSAEDPDHNQFFLQCQQNYLNFLLTSQGHVFLNEVYDALGIPRSPEGSQVGWLYGEGEGDGFIDFNLFSRKEGFQFAIGDDDQVLLDFNVDGIIWNRI